MKTPRLLSALGVSLGLAAAGIVPAFAELPNLTEPPWLGRFAVFANARYQFTVDAEGGQINVTPMGDKHEPVAAQLAIPIQIAVEELMPDGKITVRKIEAASLQSAQPATEKLTKVVITGKVGGGAAIELTIEQNHGMVLLGGRVTDPGTLKNTLRFTFSAKIPSLYLVSGAAKALSKKDEQARQKKIAGDKVSVKGLDGKHRKASLEKRVDASSADLTGTGLASAEIDSSVYIKKKIRFIASPDSALTLKNEGGGALHEGFVIRWEADKAKDPTGKARLAVDVK